MNLERLQQITARFSQNNIAVIGDYFLDKYLEVDDSRSGTSLETKKKVHQVVNVRCSPGAAGNVVNNLAAFGARSIHAVGYIGDDGEGYELSRALNGLGCSTDGLLKADGRFTPTYMKPRDCHIRGLNGEHERYDTKNSDATPPEIEYKIIEGLDSLFDIADAVMIVDQDVDENCGVVTAAVREHLIRRAKENPGIFFFVDSRKNSRAFRHIAIKANRSEITGIRNPGNESAIDRESLHRETAQLQKDTQAPVFVTLGSDGMLACDPEFHYVQGVRISGPIDFTGAGDCAAAAIVLSMVSGASAEEAALIGNLAASVAIQQLDMCGTCRPEQLPPRLELWQTQNEASK